jgi:alkylation response protein AidB-like acyl-CoA dehydrogenase
MQLPHRDSLSTEENPLRFALSDEQEQLSRAVREVHAGYGNRSPADLWHELTEMGVLGLGLPEERGGSGGGILELALVAEQTGAALAPIPMLAGPVIAGMLLRQLRTSESDPLIAELSNGNTVVAAADTMPWPACTTPVNGLDVDLQNSTMSGVLSAVPFHPGPGGTVLVLAGAGSAAALVTFQLNGEGTQVTPAATLDPSEPLAAVRLERVPVTILALGREATDAAMAAVEAASAVLALELCGTGTAVFVEAVAYAKTREQFGRTIGSFQGLKHLLADRYVELDTTRASALYACALADSDDPGAPAAARAALAAATEVAHGAARDALQVFGGIGFTYEHVAHRYLRRTRARRSLLGTPEQQLDALSHTLAIDNRSVLPG